jgi:AcrR family transcriptional regulator
MPRPVDHDDRRREIARAALEVLKEKGFRGLTLRSLAAHMGGSQTLITHYFRSRQELVDSLVDVALLWLDSLAAMDDPTARPSERLRTTLLWMLPLDEDRFVQEQLRLDLLTDRKARIRTQHLFDSWGKDLRHTLRDRVQGLVPDDELGATVDMLRALTDGLCVGVVEHPNRWPTERQIAVIDQALTLLGLNVEHEGQQKAGASDFDR